MLVKGELYATLAEALRNSYDIGICGKIVNSAGHILLVRRAGTDTSCYAWEIPGGGVEANENIASALVREIKEETGLNLKLPTRYVGCFDFHNIEKGITKRKFCFESVSDGEITLSPAHDSHRFFSLDEIKQLSTDKDSAEYIFQDHYDLILG